MNRDKDCQTVKFMIDVVNCNDGKKRQRSKTPNRKRTTRTGKSPARSIKKTLNDASGDCPCPITSTPKSSKKPLRTAGKYYTEDDLARREHSYYPVLPGFINPTTQTLTTLVPTTTAVNRKR